MNYKPHQIEKSDLCFSKVKKYGFVMLICEPRFGKTGIFIRTVELSNAKTALILTKKAAIADIEAQIDFFGAKKDYTVINYESSHKLTTTDFDIIILDEMHLLGSYPKPSQTQKRLRPLCKGKPLIYVSATPFAESYSQAYHALQLSSNSPFTEHKNFYSFHRQYGRPSSIYLYGRKINQYNLTQEDRIKHLLAPYIITGTRKEVGFAHEPTDKIHIIKLKKKTKELIRQAQKDNMLLGYPLDSGMAEMQAVYQLSGGGYNTPDGYVKLSKEKIKYIQKHFDPDTTAIMSHFIEERARLSRLFPHTFSSTAHAEGVDLSMFKDLIIYSQSFSTSKYVQRRARQANINRTTPITVHYLLADAGLDDHLYQTVAVKKKNFTARVYNA